MQNILYFCGYSKQMMAFKRNLAVKIKLLLAVAAAIYLLPGCGEGGVHSLAGADTLYIPRHARGFEILGLGKSSMLIVRNPWQGATGVERMIFVAREGEKAPEGFKGEVIRAPAARVVCMSSSYVAFLDALGCVDAVVGVSGSRFITNPAIRGRIEQREVFDIGFDSGINYELVASLKPDMLLAYGVESENTMLSGKMGELSVPMVYVGEYLEASPLGRAEWIVFFGELMDCRDEALALFDEIAGEYGYACRMATAVKPPIVMLNAPWRDVWYVPGDRNYMVELIRDAGGVYACAGYDTEKTRPIDTETAFVRAAAADFWLNPGQVATLAELTTLNPRFAAIRPVKMRRVYNCTKRSTPDGGSDFWESGVVRPDLALKDLIKIFHSELLPDHQLHYYKMLD